MIIKQPIKILQVTGALNRGGMEIMVMDLWRHISSDFQFSFLVNFSGLEYQDGIFDNELLRNGVSINTIRAQWELGPIKYLREFNKVIAETGKPDIIHIHMNAKSGIIALAAKRAGIERIIIHSHGDLFFNFTNLKSLASYIELRIQRLFINKYGTDFWGCSPNAIATLFGKQTKGFVINNAIDVQAIINVNMDAVDILKSTFKRNQDTIVLGTLGRVVRRKNLDFCIDILAELSLTGNNYCLVIAGKVDNQDYYKEILAKIAQYDLTDKVRWLGLRSDVPIVLHSFDIFISPARNEAFGMVAAEAQAAGIPCVLSAEFPETVDMKLGLVSFVHQYDTTKWAEIILSRINSDRPTKNRILQKFRELNFDITSNVKNIERLYKSRRI